MRIKIYLIIAFAFLHQRFFKPRSGQATKTSLVYPGTEIFFLLKYF